MSDPLRYDPGLEQGITDAEAVMFQCPDGVFVKYADYARLKDYIKRGTDQYNGIIDTQLKVIDELKAEIERLTAEVSYDKRVQLHVDKLAAEFTQYEVERLKAEVERLEKGIQPEGSNDAVARAVELLLEKEKEIARLKAEVELWKLRSDNWQKFCQATKEGKQS